MHRVIGLLIVCLAGTGAAQDRESAADETAPAVGFSTAAPAATANESAVAERTPSDEAVMDELELSRTEVTGNQELPKVLYIVPWRSSDPAELLGKPANSLLDEVLAPLDRTEFTRQIRYFEDLQKEGIAVDN